MHTADTRSLRLVLLRLYCKTGHWHDITVIANELGWPEERVRETMRLMDYTRYIRPGPQGGGVYGPTHAELRTMVRAMAIDLAVAEDDPRYAEEAAATKPSWVVNKYIDLVVKEPQ